jgi:hypothetical protein
MVLLIMRSAIRMTRVNPPIAKAFSTSRAEVITCRGGFSNIEKIMCVAPVVFIQLAMANNFVM